MNIPSCRPLPNSGDEWQNTSATTFQLWSSQWWLKYEVAQGRTQPWYVDRSTLNLSHAPDGVDSAIYYAEVSSWLVGAGEPPKSVAITADGVRLLEECGLI